MSSLADAAKHLAADSADAVGVPAEQLVRVLLAALRMGREIGVGECIDIANKAEEDERDDIAWCLRQHRSDVVREHFTPAGDALAPPEKDAWQRLKSA